MLVCIVVACTGWLDLSWVGNMSGLAAGGLLKGKLELLLVLVIMIRVTVRSRPAMLLVFFLLCVVVIWVRIREGWWRGRMTQSFFRWWTFCWLTSAIRSMFFRVIFRGWRWFTVSGTGLIFWFLRIGFRLSRVRGVAGYSFGIIVCLFWFYYRLF